MKLSLEKITVLLFLILYTLAAVSVSVNRYWQYQAFWYDLGIIDETIRSYARFELPIIPTLNPPQGKIVWADHFNPTLMLLAPIYWVTQKTEALLIAQVIVVVASAIVAYRIAILKKIPPVARLTLLASYLGFVGLQNALYTDVHNIVFALLPFMLALWTFYTKRFTAFFFYLLLTFGTQENMVSLGVGMAVFIWFRYPNYRKLALATLLISLAYGLLVLKLIIPLFASGSYSYEPTFPLVWHEWITRLFMPADMKLRTIVLTFATWGFLPLLVPAVWPLILWQYVERFVLNMAATRWDLGLHYNAILSPIMFLGALEGVKRLFLPSHSRESGNLYKKMFYLYRFPIRSGMTEKRWLAMKQSSNGAMLSKTGKEIWNHRLAIWSVATIGIVLIIHRFIYHGPLMLATHPDFYRQTTTMRFLDTFVDQIPQKGLLMTQNNLVAYQTHRPVMLLNKNIDKIQPDIVALDLRPGQNANNFFPLSESQAQELAASLSANLDYKAQWVTDAEVIFKRK